MTYKALLWFYNHDRLIFYREDKTKDWKAWVPTIVPKEEWQWRIE